MDVSLFPNGELPQELQYMAEKTAYWRKQKKKQLFDTINLFEAGITAKKLQKLVNLTPRQIRLLVNELRKDGKPVASGNFGYKIARTSEEVNQVMSRLVSQVDEMQEIIGRLQVTYIEMLNSEKEKIEV